MNAMDDEFTGKKEKILPYCYSYCLLFVLLSITFSSIELIVGV